MASELRPGAGVSQLPMTAAGPGRHDQCAGAGERRRARQL